MDPGDWWKKTIKTPFDLKILISGTQKPCSTLTVTISVINTTKFVWYFGEPQ